MDDSNLCYLGKEGCQCEGASCETCEHNGPDRRREDRRKRCGLFRFGERRSGFDKRHDTAGITHGLLSDLRRNSRNLLAILVLINLLNVMDFVLTVHVLEAGHQEWNPVMEFLFERSVILAGVFKVFIAGLVTVSFWWARSYRQVLLAALLVFAGYVFLIGYHIYGAIRWL